MRGEEELGFRDALSDRPVLISERGLTVLAETEEFNVEEGLHESLFFPGCGMLNHAPLLTLLTYKWLKERDLVDSMAIECCGILLGLEDEGEQLVSYHAKTLIDALREKGIRKITVGCANCYMMLDSYIRLFGETSIELVMLPQVIADAGVHFSAEDVSGFFHEHNIPYRGSEPRLAPHDSCPERQGFRFGIPHRSLVDKTVLSEMAHNGERTICCGASMAAFGRDDSARRTTEVKGQEAQNVSADALFTYCASCAWQLSNFQDAVPVVHYLEMLHDVRVDWNRPKTQPTTRYLLQGYDGARRFIGLL